MTPRVLRSLALAPLLHAAYLFWTTRGRPRARRNAVGWLSLFVVSVLVAAGYMRLDRSGASSALAWLNRYALVLAVLAGLAASVLTARRRVSYRAAATRSWTAALPLEPAAARWQALVFVCTPGAVLIGAAAALFASANVIALVFMGSAAAIVPWAAVTAALAVGTMIGYRMPASKDVHGYEGSRYVPHRRRKRPPIPVGSLSALGSWPVRRMFASARPDAVARATVPILLIMPLGSTADVALVVLGLGAICGALVLLVSSAITVSARVARWLRPLPVASRQMLQRVLMPAVALMLVAALLEAWLLWVLKAPVLRSCAIAMVTLAVSWLCAVGGAALAMAERGFSRQ